MKNLLLSSLFIFIANFSKADGTGSIYNDLGNQIISYVVRDVTCFNDEDGSIDITVLDENDYFFSWESGQNTEDLYDLSAGIYRLKIESNQGGIIWASFNIESPEILQGMIEQTNFLNSTSLDLTVQGGAQPYSYLWSNSETAEDQVGIDQEGIYEVMIQDSKGCSLNLGTYVLINGTTSVEEVEAFESNKLVYDMNGNQVNLEYSPSGMYLIVANGTVINKIIK